MEHRCDENGHTSMIVGVTGGPGTGKSTVTRMLSALGAQTANADALVRWAYNDKTFRRALVSRFGSEILNEDGAVDRNILADIVFRDESALQDLESLVHPAILEQMADMAREYQDDPERAPMLALEIPLLYETGAEKMMDRVLVVSARPETVLERLRERGWSDGRIASVLRSQWPLDEKVSRADHVITTDGSMDDTIEQVEKVWNKIIGGGS